MPWLPRAPTEGFHPCLGVQGSGVEGLGFKGLGRLKQRKQIGQGTCKGLRQSAQS